MLSYFCGWFPRFSVDFDSPILLCVSHKRIRPRPGVENTPEPRENNTAHLAAFYTKHIVQLSSPHFCFFLSLLLPLIAARSTSRGHSVGKLAPASRQKTNALRDEEERNAFVPAGSYFSCRTLAHSPHRDASAAVTLWGGRAVPTATAAAMMTAQGGVRLLSCNEVNAHRERR